jgi:poly(U)-specific endoribonuclease
MEGLVKGLLDIAIGNDDNRGDRDNSQDRDERSRSSWAEVVSGEQDNDNSSNDRRHGSKEEQRHGRANESRPSVNPPQMSYGRDEDNRRNDYNKQSHRNNQVGEENNDGWETVGKKPTRRHQEVHMEQWNNYKRPAEEQDYSDNVQQSSIDMDPTRAELADLSTACNKLWELDLNRLTPGTDYQIDCGDGKKVYQKEDMAEGSLFSWVNRDIFKKPTFSRFCSLLDNYNPHEGSKEQVTSQEKQEEAAFIEEISRTAPIIYLHKYLCEKGIVSDNYTEFKGLLKSLWFDLYGRAGTSSCSSAFEHVFVGEIKQRGEEQVSGFHNWLQFYLEEAKGKVDYQGYIFPRRRGQILDSDTQLLTIQFEWNGVLKSVSSTLVGVSPEFEIALYTLCFFVGQEDNHVELGPYPVNVKCYRLGNKIGSAFPIADN